MTNTLHRGDLPDDLDLGDIVAIDCETLGLKIARDRLCLIQLSAGDGNAHLVQFSAASNQASDDGEDGTYAAPNLIAMLADPKVTKLFHFGRFDIAVIFWNLGVLCEPVYCTKIASRLTRTYSDRHGLKDLCKDLIGVDLSKQQQLSDWGAAELTKAQLSYAASDVLHLHALKEKLDAKLARERRADLADDCFRFLPSRAVLDLAGWAEEDIFSH